MSAIALKRSYQLEMPMSYVNIESNEMEYIEGGRDKVNYWWGTSVNVYNNELEDELQTWKTLKRTGIVAGGALAFAGFPIGVPFGLLNTYECDTVIDGIESAIRRGTGVTISERSLGVSGVSISVW